MMYMLQLRDRLDVHGWGVKERGDLIGLLRPLLGISVPECNPIAISPPIGRLADGGRCWGPRRLSGAKPTPAHCRGQRARAEDDRRDKYQESKHRARHEGARGCGHRGGAPHLAARLALSIILARWEWGGMRFKTGHGVWWLRPAGRPVFNGRTGCLASCRKIRAATSCGP